MKTLHIRHRTLYGYSAPVELGRHRLMLRPRDSHDLRLIDATLTLDPPATVTWVHDVFGNSIALLDFAGPTTRLEIVSELVLERYDTPHAGPLLAPEAETYPFVYGSDERIDLGRLADRHYPDDGAVRSFVERVAPTRPMPTLDLLATMNRAIGTGLRYGVRVEEGTRPPAETLAQGGGSCRDYALLLMEAARELGLGARFVTGYLFDGGLDGPASTGVGHTHAWAEIYLPGPGWVEFDPTNGLIGSDHLVRVAAVRDPKQAAPVSGSYTGFGGSALTVEVTVRPLRPPPVAAELPAPVAAA